MKSLKTEPTKTQKKTKRPTKSPKKKHHSTMKPSKRKGKGKTFFIIY